MIVRQRGEIICKHRRCGRDASPMRSVVSHPCDRKDVAWMGHPELYAKWRDALRAATRGLDDAVQTPPDRIPFDVGSRAAVCRLDLSRDHSQISGVGVFGSGPG